MNSRSVRFPGRLSATALIAILMISPASVARAADNTFVLDNAGTSGTPGGVPRGNYDQTFAGVEIRATPDPATGKYDLEANDWRIPLSWDWGQEGKTVTGTGSFLMRGTYDPVTNAVTGTFTMEQEATGTLVYKVGTYSLKFALIWKGDVTGSVANNVAELYFSGTDTTKCTLGSDDCGSSGTQGQRVWFDVSNANYTVVPGASSTPESIAVVVSGATGDVYYSPADQADLAPADRTWTVVKPGDRIALDEGVMLRTGGNSSLKVEFTTGARFRLHPSTLFGVKKIENMRTPTSQWTMYGRLYEGIAWFYMEKWKEDHRGFEVETDRAILTIKGTTYAIAVTPEATVVTVAEGVVAVTDKATGTSVDVGANERATVDASGMAKTAAPDAAALLDENAPPGASSAAASLAADATPAPVAAGSAAADVTPAPAAPSGGDSGGSSLPIVLGIVAAVVVVVAVAGFLSFRRRRPLDPQGS